MTKDHLDNDKEELRESILNLTGMCGGPYDYAHRCSALHCDHCGVCDYSEEILAIVEAHTQSKLKAFAGEVEKAIGEDEKEFNKQSRPYEDSDTDKLWDLANGIEPISSGQISTWGGSANTQFRKFALKLRNTIWKEAELHKNELREELRESLKAIKEKAGIE